MKYFSIEELCRSQKATELKIDNTPDTVIKDNLEFLITRMLDPLRTLYGKSIFINSGYRCSELNRAIGGSPTSRHQYGYCADMDTRRGENRMLADIIVLNRIPFRQMILYSSLDAPKWVHIDVSRIENKGQILLKKDGKYIDITNKYIVRL